MDDYQMLLMMGRQAAADILHRTLLEQLQTIDDLRQQQTELDAQIQDKEQIGARQDAEIVEKEKAIKDKEKLHDQLTVRSLALEKEIEELEKKDSEGTSNESGRVEKGCTSSTLLDHGVERTGLEKQEEKGTMVNSEE